MRVTTPLNVDAWEAALASHPDRAYINYIAQGLHEGFRIGFQWGAPLRSAKHNMPSTRLQPNVITDYTAKELSKGRIKVPSHPHGDHYSTSIALD